MQITYNFHRENEDDITVFFTLTDDQGVEYQFHADIPKDVSDIQAHLEKNTRWYLRCIRLKEYPGSYYREYEGEDELEKIENWISKNAGEEKKPFKSTHEKPDPRDQKIIELEARIAKLEDEKQVLQG